MAFNRKTGFLFVLIAFVGVYISMAKERKPKNRLTLCGSSFFSVYKYCCTFDCRDGNGNGMIPGKRDMIYRKQIPPWMQKNSAVSFLKYRKPRLDNSVSDMMRRDMLSDNATEECCYEGCTLEEVREYPCGPT